MGNQPVPVEFAFQGGGAKFTELLIVAWAALELEREGRISINRCVGTSAGSIAAAMLAARVDIGAAIDSLRGEEGKALLRSVQFPGRFIALWNVLNGKPILSFAEIRRWLERVLVQGKQVVRIHDTLESSGTELVITRCRLSTREGVVSEGSASLIDAIQQSCAIPFLFVGWPEIRRPDACVDGGLANNLPTDLLRRSDDLASLAISFSRDLGARADGLFGFAHAVVDIALFAQEDHARAKLPNENTLDLVTQIGTLGFAEAFAKINDVAHVRNARSAARDWILKRVGGGGKAPARLYPVNFWRDESYATRVLMGINAELYCSQERDVHLQVKLCRMTVKSNLTRPVGDPFYGSPDEVQLDMTIVATEQPVRSMCFILFGSDSRADFCLEVPDVTVQRQDGRRVQCRLVPARFESETGAERQTILHFLEPLLPGEGTYTVSYRESVMGLTNSLISRNRDELSYAPDRAKGKIDRIEMIAYLFDPGGSNYRMIPKQENGSGVAVGRKMGADELPGNENNLRAFGWIGEQLDADEIRHGWGVDVITESRTGTA